MTQEILLITDDQETLSVVQTALMHKAVAVVHTDSIERAVNQLRYSMPAVMILDLTMKEARTLPFLQRLKMRSQFENLPVLVIVSDPDPAVIKHALEMGADRYLTRVFISQNLSRTINDMLGVKNAG